MWKGRLQFRQYIPLKRARFEIKLFCLAEDSGYIYRFRIYTGKQDPTITMMSVMPPECVNFSNTQQVVVYMALPLLYKGYTIFMDNWFSSCQLYDYLHHRQTTACGTTRLDWVEQGLTSHQTHCRSYRGRVFMGQMTQPTVSKH